MKKILLIGAVIASFAFAGIAYSQQPSVDTLDLDEDDCTVIVEFNDGTEDSESIEIFVNDIRTHNIVFNDVVGDQSRTVAVLELDEDDEVLARLNIANEDEFEVDLVVGECPTPTPTATATNTPTSVPATATPVPTQIPTAVPPTPQVIIIQVPAPTAVPTIVTVRPPSTGDGGLR